MYAISEQLVAFSEMDISLKQGKLTTSVCYYWLILYSAILRSRADSLHSNVILHEWIAFYSAFFEYPPKWCTYSAGMAGATTNCCHLSMFCVHHNNHAPCHFMQSHIHKVYACLAVTCHLHFWQNDRGLLRATAVTWGWNGYWNKNQHRKLTLEKKIFLPIQQGFEPSWVWIHAGSAGKFYHESGALTTELSLPLLKSNWFPFLPVLPLFTLPQHEKQHPIFSVPETLTPVF